MDRLDDAERCYRSAITILRELGDWVRVGPVLLNTGYLHLRRGDHGKAIAAFRESLEVFERSGAIGGRGSAYANLGLVHHDMGDLDEAERYYLLAIEDNRTVAAAARADSSKVGDRRGLAQLLGRLAKVHLDRGEVARAVEGHREEVRLLRFVGDKRLLADAVHALGEALLVAGDVGAAREAWSEALPLYEDLGDDERVAAVRERLFFV
ncbi:tetratricopeptide repeat protein [Kitasatospora sp. NPDC093558]|uniref:tetratricopeptide repeat protein n=1 Tax=Kitasatospora sp. NPDC093558 TaxID=3155201 RepID=UPI00343B4780